MATLLIAFSLLLVFAFLTITFSFTVGVVFVLLAIMPPAWMVLREGLGQSAA